MGVVAAVIGVVGTVVAAIIGSSDKPSPASSHAEPTPSIVIQAVTFEPRPNGGRRIRVFGLAPPLTEGHSIRAIARPRDDAQASDAAGSESDGSASDSADWLASNPVAPNASGQWAATIRTPPPPRAVTVVAVEMPEPAGLDGDPEDCTNCSPSSTIDHVRALRRRGPAAPDVVSASEPVEARPD